MRCDEVAEVLQCLQNGSVLKTGKTLAPGDVRALEALARTGHVEAFQEDRNGSAELDRRRRSLMERMGKYPEVYAMPEEERAALDRERNELLDLAESVGRREGSISLAGRRFALTFRGRTLLSDLLARLPRVSGMELPDFEREIDDLRTELSAQAAEARRIFGIIRRDLPLRDDSELRSAAVGLAALGADRDGAIGAFRAATKALVGRVPPERVVLLAETLVVGRGEAFPLEVEADAAAILELNSRIGGTEDRRSDALATASLLIAWGDADRQRLLREAIAFRDALASRSGGRAMGLPACIMAACVGLPRVPGALEALPDLHARLLADGLVDPDAELVSVILCMAQWRAGFDPVRQFLTAREYLSRFSGDGMDVPAALLATLPVGTEEALDDLRLASAAVANAGLPSGGIESLSLGLKLLMLAAAPEAQGQAVRAARHLALPLMQRGMGRSAALAAIAVLHGVSIHEIASSEAAFHPLHVHYIYG